MNNYEFIVNDEVKTVSLEDKNQSWEVTDGERKIIFHPVGENLYRVNAENGSLLVAAVFHKGTYYIDIDSVLFEIKEALEDEFAGGAGGLVGEKDKIYAPMPGKIVKIMVNVGDEIVEKQPMVIVEAMKMENQVNSKAKGKVKAINFSAGDQVDIETPIIELELEESGDS
ncbi:MAG: acetyl-CoA carboxylase biotin carboxyl carrier protein subunit [FCB group bacterium]|nr:acetyl-CoA carboxylase biotin carboxyl carrier protein subunit [FCB group bacterium]